MRSTTGYLVLFVVAVGLVISVVIFAVQEGRSPGLSASRPASPARALESDRPPGAGDARRRQGSSASDLEVAEGGLPPQAEAESGGWMLIPVRGIRPEDLGDTFAETRDGRPHGALDISAPRWTPVVAAEAGEVQKIWESKPGGHTVYVLGASGRFRYYYAHLEAYRPGLAEGQAVGAGELIGYVGDSGNAVPGDTHLHFGVFLVDDPADWAGGTAVDPRPYLMREVPLTR